jgi:hypothetical protein
MTAVPPYLRAKATLLPEGHDDTLDPPEPPTDAARRTVAPSSWPAVNRSAGPLGPPDGAAGPPGVDPLARSLAPFSWPRSHVSEFVGDLDPDLALWPGILLTRWPFTGPPTTGVWPLGWIGVDNQATVWVCTQGGQPGSWAPLTSAVNTGPVSITQYGADPTGVLDSTTAVQTCLAQNLNVYVPPGTFKISAPLNMQQGAIMSGAGPGSILQWPVDLGSTGTTELPGEVIALTVGAGVLRDLALHGPGYTNTSSWGNVTAYMNGLTFNTSGMVDNVQINGFYTGIVWGHTQHVHLRRVQCNFNYYGWRIPDWSDQGGDIVAISCSTAYSNMAGLKTGAGIHWGGNTVIEWTTSSTPLAIFITNGFSGFDVNGRPQYNGTTVTSGQLISSTFRQIDAEVMGNAFILDISSNYLSGNASVNGCTFEVIGYQTNASPPACAVPPIPVANQNRNWMIAAGFYGTTWDTRSVMPGPILLPNSLYTAGLALTQTQLDLFNLPTPNAANTIFSSAGAGTTWSPIGGRTINRLPTIDDGWGDRALVVTANAAITCGQFVEVSSLNPPTVIPATGTKVPLGIAISSQATTGAPVLVQVRGTNNVTSATTNGAVAGQAIAAGALVSLYTTTPTQVAPAASNATMPVVGWAMQAAGVGAGVVLSLRL